MVRLETRRTWLLATVLICASGPPLALTAWGADWPQFRGPNRTDVSEEKNLLREWPAEGPPVAWKGVGLGEGFSSVAVAGDRVYSMGDVKDSSYLTALDRATGKSLWSTPVGKPGGNYKGTRCTPCVDGDRVYGLGQFGDFICCDSKTGKELWRKNLIQEFGGRHGSWQYSESPLVDGNKVLCTPGGKDAAVVAFDKKSGELIWKGAVPGNDSAGYSSIVISEAGGVRQYVQLMANGLVSFSAADGKMLWRYGENGDRFGGNTANIPTPIVQGDYVFASAGYSRGGALLKLSGENKSIMVEEVYFERRLQNRHGGVVLVGDYVYGDLDDSGNPWCADWKTGKVAWKKAKRTEGQDSAAITYADGRLYMQYQNGVVALVAASPEAYEEISVFKIPDARPPCWAHPVVSGGKLLIRNQDTLWCHDIRVK